MRDAVVVGAGPAGALAAAELAARGQTVLLVDRAMFPRDKVCGGCLHPAAAATLRAAGMADVLRAAVPLRRYRLAAGGRTVTLGLRGWSACSRRTLDGALVRAAVERGAEFRDRTHAEPDGAGFVRLNGERTAARVVLVATGLGGRASRGSHFGAGAVHEGPLPGFEEHCIHMACGPGGYVGLVRAEEGRSLIAAALAPSLVRAAGSIGGAAGRILPALPELAWRGTPLLTRRGGRAYADRMLVLGDRAGYAEPFTGEGISWALASAREAAALLAEGWQPGTGRAWARARRRVLGRRLWWCRALTRGLRTPRLARALVALLGRAPFLARPWTRGGTR